jgi:UPF0755 protein
MISAIFSFFIFRSKALSSRVSDSNIAQLFEIEKNEGAKTIGIKLAEANLVKNKYYFYYYLRSENLTQKIQAGKYELSPNMSIQEITRKIVEGKIKEAYQKLVIPEGFTNTKIIERVKELDLTLGEEFEKIVNCRCQTGVDCDCMDFRNKYSFLTNLPDGIDLEGYLFPDTYYVYLEDDAVKLAVKFINNFELLSSPKLFS